MNIFWSTKRTEIFFILVAFRFTKPFYYKSSGGGRIIAEYKNGKWSLAEDQEYKI